MTVRHWLAARLQDKLRNPRQANVPRVECPEDPTQRRESIATVFPDTILYNSEEEVADVATQESVDAAGDATQLQRPREHLPRRKATRRSRRSARATDIEHLRLPRNLVDVTVPQPQGKSQAGQRKSNRRGATGVSSLSHPSFEVAPSRSPNQHSNDNNPTLPNLG